MTPEQVKRASELLERRTSLQEQVSQLTRVLPYKPTAGSPERATLTFEEKRGTQPLTVTVAPLDILALLREYVRRVEVDLEALGVRENTGDFNGE